VVFPLNTFPPAGIEDVRFLRIRERLMVTTRQKRSPPGSLSVEDDDNVSDS